MAADLGIAIAARLIEVLGSKIIQEVGQMWKYKSQLEDLKETVSTIHTVLTDADAKRELSHEEEHYIARLKDVVYDADDLFDEIRTLAELKQLKSLSKVDKLIAKVRSDFSFQRYREVKDLKMRIDSIANNHTKFGFSVDYKPIIVRRRTETCSYVDVKGIIGREKDKEAIIDMLMDPSVDDDSRFLTIVGVGGLGKTALAQLVFNDEKVQKEFPSLRSWVCVSDQDGEQFDVKVILCKILEAFTSSKLDVNLSLEVVKNRFENAFRGQKFLLVLDDVWNENRGKWVDLRGYLLLGAIGSKIMVTTRSKMTGDIIGNKRVYDLHGLSYEDSWSLFEMSAFEEGEKHHELVKIGRKIVQKCHRNPLAIKVVGSLLYGQDISKWQSIGRSGLDEVNMGNDEIYPVLELSYHNLRPSLKRCFSYCAVFPKDYEMSKEMLIGLWMAQGYIVSLDGGQNIEEAAEEHFLILMRRCFFQDVKKDMYGDVKSVKIHDLMHDVAKKVAKEEICVLSAGTSDLGKTIRHVNVIGGGFPKNSSSRIRSYICRHNKVHVMDETVVNMTVLRVLDLSQSPIGTLLKSIDRLLLLRYLNLSGNTKLTSLPDSIAKLYNLQTLLLRDCSNLREFPDKFCNLINLRHLDVYGCKNLVGMPLNFDKLTNLRVLPFFKAGSDDELKVLRVFTELQGNLHIVIGKNYGYVDGVNNVRGGYLKSMKHLKNCSLKFDSDVNPEGLLEKLEPPSNLKGLILENYYGKTIPWSKISLQCLVDLQITNSWRLKQVPVLSKLPHLKSLVLKFLDNLEYIEYKMSSDSSDTELATITLFPSLESLRLESLRMLRGWCNTELLKLVDGSKFRLRFPRLSYMDIFDCPNLTSLTSCPNPEHLHELELPCLYELEVRHCPKLISNIICPSLENLRLDYVNERLQITCEYTKGVVAKLREVNIDKVSQLKPLPTYCLTKLVIDGDIKVESLSEVEEKFIKCASSLRTLDIRYCVNLRGLKGLEHLTALEELSLLRNDRLSFSAKDDEEPWKSFRQSLRSLKFCSLQKMVSLPKGMQYLTSLQTLEISHCPGIKSLPEGLRNLTSIKRIAISLCPDLERRCSKPDGEDFSKIQHIPKINID